MSGTQRGLSEFNYIEIELSITLAADCARVFDCLTGDISAWWGAPYLLDAGATRVVLEAQPGGRLFEHWSELPKQCHAEGALWGVVTQIADAELIVIEGDIGMGWPTLGRVSFELKEATPGETLLSLRHQAYGKIGSDAAENYRFGWRDLLDRRLRAWVERGEKMGVGSEPLPWQGLLPE